MTSTPEFSDPLPPLVHHFGLFFLINLYCGPNFDDPPPPPQGGRHMFMTPNVSENLIIRIFSGFGFLMKKLNIWPFWPIFGQKWLILAKNGLFWPISPKPLIRFS